MAWPMDAYGQPLPAGQDGQPVFPMQVPMVQPAAPQQPQGVGVLDFRPPSTRGTLEEGGATPDDIDHWFWMFFSCLVIPIPCCCYVWTMNSCGKKTGWERPCGRAGCDLDRCM